MGLTGAYNGTPGHLWIKFKIETSPHFRRAGPDIFVTAPISFTTAALGGHVLVPTLTGEAKVKVPAGTQSGDKRAMRNKGIPVVNRSNSFGTQYITFHVEVPRTLTDEQRKLLEEFKDLSEGGGEPEEKPHPTEAPEAGESSGTGDGQGKKGKDKRPEVRPMITEHVSNFSSFFVLSSSALMGL